MLILYLLHLIFPSTVSRTTWHFTLWPKLPLERTLPLWLVTGCLKTWGWQWEAFWIDFQLWHLTGKAALHPSSHCCSTGTTGCCPCHLPAFFTLYNDNFPRIWSLLSDQTQPPSGCQTTPSPPRAGTKPNKQNPFELCPATHGH